jgi:hypothetical protein
MRPSHVIAVLIVFLAACESEPEVVSREIGGTVEPERPQLGCLPADRLRSTMDPVDLFASMRACLLEGDVDRATLLFALGGLYGRFDMARVEDLSAHQVIRVLEYEQLGGVPEERRRMLHARQQQVSADASALLEICRAVRGVGPPSYEPRYMLRHGMDAVLGRGTGNGLVDGFDAAATWDRLQREYLHCPIETIPGSN